MATFWQSCHLFEHKEQYMPRPRFSRLSSAKQEHILEEAAKEFAAHGYEGASLNQILNSAGISKGAAYYYFDDKADLYTSTILHYSQQLMGELSFDPDQLTAANFWVEVAGLYRQQLTAYIDRPWVFGVAKAGGALPAELQTHETLAQLLEQAQLLLLQLLRRGRELGVVRSDLPEALLLALVIAVDDAHDQWLYAHWQEQSTADLEAAALRASDTLRRLLCPA
jgi:AcrR family transcriptional regulator